MADEKANFTELTRKKYIDQAKWFLNGFWKEGLDKETENVWKFTHKFVELDPAKKEGCELDEFMAHKFLESLGETLTVVQLREKLRKIDMDCNGRMALLEYLAFRYDKTVKAVINCPQGDNTAAVEEASAKLQAVQDAYTQVQNQLDEQTKALEDQIKAEEGAKKALENQKIAEETVRKAESELKAAIDDLKSQEENFAKQKETLENKSKDPNNSTVTKNKTAAELAQLKQEDPMPLRKAKITQEAVLRKVEKERKAAEAATAAAEVKSQDAAAKTKALEEQKRLVDAAFTEAEKKVKEAVDFLEDVKRKGGQAQGALWWLEREFKESQKYLPKRKQQQV